MEGLGALSFYMASPPVIARWNRSGTQEGDAECIGERSADGVEPPSNTGISGTAGQGSALYGIPGAGKSPTDFNRSLTDAALDGEQGIGPVFPGSQGIGAAPPRDPRSSRVGISPLGGGAAIGIDGRPRIRQDRALSERPVGDAPALCRGAI